MMRRSLLTARKPRQIRNFPMRMEPSPSPSPAGHAGEGNTPAASAPRNPTVPCRRERVRVRAPISLKATKKATNVHDLSVRKEPLTFRPLPAEMRGEETPVRRGAVIRATVVLAIWGTPHPRPRVPFG